MNKKTLLFYAFGTVLWFLLLGLMPLNQHPTDMILLSYGYLTVGMLLGGWGWKFMEKTPWIFVFIPFLSLLAGMR